jgi:hypothetical protein
MLEFPRTALRLRGEVGLRSNPGEGDSPRIVSLRFPLTLALIGARLGKRLADRTVLGGGAAAHRGGGECA